MICLVQKVSLRLIRGIAMGVAFIDQSFVILKAMPLLTLHPVLMSVAINWEMLFVGLLITFAYFSLFVKIPFKVIDLVLKLCFVIIMLPVFIVCYPFQATRGYSKKGWNLLLSVLVEMLSLCVFIGLALALIDHGLVNS